MCLMNSREVRYFFFCNVSFIVVLLLNKVVSELTLFYFFAVCTLAHDLALSLLLFFSSSIPAVNA